MCARLSWVYVQVWQSHLSVQTIRRGSHVDGWLCRMLRHRRKSSQTWPASRKATSKRSVCLFVPMVICVRYSVRKEKNKRLLCSSVASTVCENDSSLSLSRLYV